MADSFFLTAHDAGVCRSVLPAPRLLSRKNVPAHPPCGSIHTERSGLPYSVFKVQAAIVSPQGRILKNALLPIGKELGAGHARPLAVIASSV